MQCDMYPGEPARQLQRLSDTRWASRVFTCRNIRDRLDALVCTLEDIADSSHSDRALEARDLVVMIDLNLVMFLHLFCDLLGKVHVISTQLQSSSVDLSTAAELINNLIASVKESRDAEDIVGTIFSAAEAMCNKCNMVPSLSSRRPRKLSRRLGNSVVEETVGIIALK